MQITPRLPNPKLDQGLTPKTICRPAVGRGAEKIGVAFAGRPDQAEAERLAQYGPNEIPEKKTNPLLKFLCYFWGPIPWMIEVAVILSAPVGHWPDFSIILVLLLANAVVGFWEEHQAGNAIAALKAKLAIKARVKRDGKWVTLPRNGARATSFACALATSFRPTRVCWTATRVDQSALTGESSRRAQPATPSSLVHCAARRDRRAGYDGRNTYSARRRNWRRRPTLSAISRKPC